MSSNKGILFESDYEEAFIQLLEQPLGKSELKWIYTPGDQLPERKETDALIEADLRGFLCTQYRDKSLSTDDIKRIIANLRNVGGSNFYESLRNACQLYLEGYNYTFSDSSKPSFRLNYIDFEHPEHNTFRVVNQFTMIEGQANRRPDVILFINGIPVCIIELKNPTKVSATTYDAWEQIKVRYNRDIPSLTKYCAVACVSDGIEHKLGTVITPYEYFYAWKKVNNEDEPHNNGLDALQTLIEGAFAPDRLLEILRDYVYFPDASSDEEKEIICRYPQFFATRKLRDNVISALHTNGGDGRGGTYFGATGCGKTFTMLFLARQLALRCANKLSNPTIILIVDREDLETQAAKLFCQSKHYLCDEEVKIFESREDLCKELSSRKGGGFYITTIQKFTESTGLLSDRANIVCMSDEAHRSQTNLGDKITINTEAEKGKLGAFITKGFAAYLRAALPKATYVGFTGTPIDDTVKVFGAVVDKYTMAQSKEDGITVDIKYSARLARVFTDEEQLKKIEEYYSQCEEDGVSEEQIRKSKSAMASMSVILGEPDRLRRVAKDIVTDYELRLQNEPELLQKAMITCADRFIAYQLLNFILELRPEWGVAQKSLDESSLSEEQIERLHKVPYINMIATRGANDPADMYDYLGTNERRDFLDKEFKSNESNFHIAIVVDMWITGFDCPSLRYLYNDKPLSKHTLIQTISRVNRKYKSKEYGMVIDYIGIRTNMMKAMKVYGGEETIDGGDMEIAYHTLCTELQILKEMTHSLDFAPFFDGSPLARMQFLQKAAEFILSNSFEPTPEDIEKAKKLKQKLPASLKKRFIGHVRVLRSAYNICAPAGDILNEDNVIWSNCFMGVAAYISKLTGGPININTINKTVEKMLTEALQASEVESVYDDNFKTEDIFSDVFLKQLDEMHAPSTKFELLSKLLERKIDEYAKVNKVQAKKFSEMLEDVIDAYNTRDKFTFANEVAGQTIDSVNALVEEKVKSLTERLLEIFRGLNKDKEEFRALGITFEEKAFFDILVDIRNRNGFEYPDERCISLAKKIKELVDGTAIYADFLNNNNLRNQMASEIAYLIYKEGYPPQWDDEVFRRVLDQVQNYKKYN